MTGLKTVGIVFLLLLSMPAAAQILSWGSDSKTYTEKLKIQESITNLDTVTIKPEQKRTLTVQKETATFNQSILPYLEHLPVFPENEMEPDAVWENTAQVTWDLSDFSISVPVTVTVRASYRFIEETTVNSKKCIHIYIEWYPFWIPEVRTAKKSGIERLSGYSHMDLYWDNTAGFARQFSLMENLQYRFMEGTALLVTKNTEAEFTEKEIPK